MHVALECAAATTFSDKQKEKKPILPTSHGEFVLKGKQNGSLEVLNY